jgi:hypothetical protein
MKPETLDHHILKLVVWCKSQTARNHQATNIHTKYYIDKPTSTPKEMSDSSIAEDNELNEEEDDEPKYGIRPTI